MTVSSSVYTEIVTEREAIIMLCQPILCVYVHEICHPQYVRMYTHQYLHSNINNVTAVCTTYINGNNMTE